MSGPETHCLGVTRPCSLCRSHMALWAHLA